MKSLLLAVALAILLVPAASAASATVTLPPGFVYVEHVPAAAAIQNGTVFGREVLEITSPNATLVVIHAQDANGTSWVQSLHTVEDLATLRVQLAGLRAEFDALQLVLSQSGELDLRSALANITGSLNVTQRDAANAAAEAKSAKNAVASLRMPSLQPLEADVDDAQTMALDARAASTGLLWFGVAQAAAVAALVALEFRRWRRPASFPQNIDAAEPAGSDIIERAKRAKIEKEAALAYLDAMPDAPDASEVRKRYGIAAGNGVP